MYVQCRFVGVYMRVTIWGKGLYMYVGGNYMYMYMGTFQVCECAVVTNSMSEDNKLAWLWLKACLLLLLDNTLPECVYASPYVTCHLPAHSQLPTPRKVSVWERDYM